MKRWDAAKDGQIYRDIQALDNPTLQPIDKPHVSSETWGLPYQTQIKQIKTKRARKRLPE